MHNFCGLIGISDVGLVCAEGLNMGEESQTARLASANSELARRAA